MIRSHTKSRRRCRLLFLLLIGFFAVFLRLLQVQVFQNQHYDTLAKKQHIHKVKIQEARGSILDRHGRPLAISHQARSLYVDPSRIQVEHLPLIAEKLQSELGLHEEDIIERCTRERMQFVYLKRFLNATEEKNLRSFVWQTPGLGFREEWTRSYPSGSMLSPVLGLVGRYDQQGKMGLEAGFEDLLKSVEGEKLVFRDNRKGQVSVQPIVTKEAQAGTELSLTIDRTIQTFLYKELEKGFREQNPLSACGVVVDVMSGEMLAMASMPSQNPLERITDQQSSLKPRMVVDVFEPGSTMKPLIYAGLIENQIAHPSQIVDCNMGEKRFNHRIIHDVHPYGKISLEEGIVKSSNIAAAHMGLMLGKNRLYHLINELGFGEKSYLPLPGESDGTVYPLSKWNYYSETSIPMGHEISCSMIQMTMAYAALANGGYMLQPWLIRCQSSEKNGLEFFEPVCFRRVFSTRTCSIVQRALEQVVERGTARRARSKLYRIAGKTGTSEKYSAGRVDKKKNRALFVGYAPASEPRIAIMIVFDEPKRSPFGGVVSAPIAKAVIENTLQYLGVPPDRPLDEG